MMLIVIRTSHETDLIARTVAADSARVAHIHGALDLWTSMVALLASYRFYYFFSIVLPRMPSADYAIA